MARIRKNEKNDGVSNVRKNVMGPVMVGMAGAAAIGATALALSNKKIRKNIGKALEGVVDQGKEAFGDLQEKVQMQIRDLGKRARNAIEAEKTKTRRRLSVRA